MARQADLRRVVAANIEYYSKMRNLSMTELASATGMARQSLSKKLNLSSEFKLSELIHIARTLRCTVRDLVTEKGGTE